MNVVSILAHQDDEMFCLGTMLRCRARGDRLAFLTLTDGSNGFVQNPARPRAEAAGIRQAEMQALADAVDATYQCLGERDGFLADTPDLRVRLIEAIRNARADVIFTHTEADYNLDHTTTQNLVRHCTMLAALPVTPTESAPLTEHPAIFEIEPHGPSAFAPTHFVDITGVHADKGALIALHRSQEEAFRQGLGYGLAEMISKVSAFRGWQAGCEQAEGFVSMRSRGAIKPGAVLP